jgi:hypothetical protein
MDPGRDGRLLGDGPELPIGDRDGQERPQLDDAEDAGDRPQNHDFQAHRRPVDCWSHSALLIRRHFQCPSPRHSLRLFYVFPWFNGTPDCNSPSFEGQICTARLHKASIFLSERHSISTDAHEKSCELPESYRLIYRLLIQNDRALPFKVIAVLHTK